MAPGKNQATARTGRKGRRVSPGSPSQDQGAGQVRTYRVIIKDGVFVGGPQRRRKGVAS
jgi:hypothetical protein